MALIAAGTLVLLVEMAGLVAKFHAFTPMFWVLSWSATILLFVLRAQTRPPQPGALRRTLVWYAVASAVSIGGWCASPALNAWLQSW